MNLYQIGWIQYGVYARLRIGLKIVKYDAALISSR